MELLCCADVSMWGPKFSNEITVDHYNSSFPFAPSTRSCQIQSVWSLSCTKTDRKKGVRSDCRLNRVNICTHTHTVMVSAGPVLFLILSELFQLDERKQKNIEMSSRFECLSIIDKPARARYQGICPLPVSQT